MTSTWLVRLRGICPKRMSNFMQRVSRQGTRLIEPDRGWILLSIDDLGGQDGTCERNGCGAEIRYEHLTYHPKWGYMVVGSTCIEHLTQEDRQLSSSIVHLYKNVAGFVHKSHWDEGVSQRRRFIYSTYKHHQLRIYGEEPRHSFQLLLKKKGVWVFDYTNEVETPGKSTLTVKELAYTTMRGRLSDSEEEKGALRNLYRALMYDTMQTPHQCGSEEP